MALVEADGVGEVEQPVLAALAAEDGLQCRTQRYKPSPAGDRAGYYVSRWALLVRTPADLGAVARDGRWRACRGDGSRVWTDDYSNLIGEMSFG